MVLAEVLAVEVAEGVEGVEGGLDKNEMKFV